MSERLETLERLAMEAWDLTWSAPDIAPCSRSSFARHARERMAQAAQAMELEAPSATLAEVDRALDRVRVLLETVDRLNDEKRVAMRDRYLLEGKLESTRAALVDEARAHTETREKLEALEAEEAPPRVPETDGDWLATMYAATDIENARRADYRRASAEFWMVVASRIRSALAADGVAVPASDARPPPTNLERVTLEAVRGPGTMAEDLAKAARRET